jgi:uncharacterized membrane protein
VVALACLRVLIITVLLTILAFAVALFLAVVGILLANMARGGGINMAHAYRHIALPIAIVTACVALVLSMRSELSYVRRQRAQRDTRQAA